MRLLAKQPADRPPSAQAVVEAIKGIERALLTERQRAELSVATPLPAAADSTRVVRVGMAGEPDLPDLAAKSRNHRRALGITAALALLGMSVVGADLVLFSRKARTVAAASPVPIAVAATEPSAQSASRLAGARSGTPPGPPLVRGGRDALEHPPLTKGGLGGAFRHPLPRGLIPIVKRSRSRSPAHPRARPAPSHKRSQRDRRP